MSIQDTQHQLTLLADGLQGLGVSLSIHHTGRGPGITNIHAAQLSHLVECCGLLAEKLSVELEDLIPAQASE